MEDIFNKIKEKVSYGLADNADAKYDTLKALNKASSELSEEKHFTDFLKDKDDLMKVYLLVKNKKLSNNQIRKKIKEYLKDPEELRNFLQSVLDSNKTKHKEECIKYYKSYQTASKKNKDGRYDTNIEAYKAFFDRPKKLSNGTTISCKDFKRISTFERFKWDNI